MAKKSNFPLRLHGNGQWCKKVNGKRFYFGIDKEKALLRWQAEMDHIKAGRPVPRKDPSPRLDELGNVYLARCKAQLAAGKFSLRHVTGIEKTIHRLITLRGADDRPATWTPQDFSAINADLAKPIKRTLPADGQLASLTGKVVKVRSSATVAGDIRRIKAFLNWAADDDQQHIPPPKFGKDFTVSKTALLRHSKNRGRLDLPKEHIRQIIDRASVHYKPLCLMGINLGIGGKDLSLMSLADVERCAKDPWLSAVRNKTGAARRAWLWPETRAAIANYLEARQRPYLKEFEDVGFLTAQRRPWLEEKDGSNVKDSVAWTFASIRRKLELPRGTFYDLRRTFETIAGETLDQPAIDLCMGHVEPADSMAALYRQNIGDDRVKHVCQHVRKWLFGK